MVAKHLKSCKHATSVFMDDDRIAGCKNTSLRACLTLQDSTDMFSGISCRPRQSITLNFNCTEPLQDYYDLEHNNFVFIQLFSI